MIDYTNFHINNNPYSGSYSLKAVWSSLKPTREELLIGGNGFAKRSGLPTQQYNSTGSLVGWWRLNEDVSTAGSCLDSGWGPIFTGSFSSSAQRPSFSGLRPSTATYIATASNLFNGTSNVVKVAVDTATSKLSFGHAAPSSAEETPFSISAWVRRTGGGAFDTVVHKGSNHSTNLEYQLVLKQHGSVCDSTIMFKVSDSASGAYVRAQSSLGVLTGSTWYHIVATYNGKANAAITASYGPGIHHTSYGDVAQDVMSLYINGEKKYISGTSSNLRSYRSMTNSSEPVYIGSRVSSNYFSGSLVDIAVWNEELTKDNVKALYNASKFQPYISFKNWTVKGSKASNSSSLEPFRQGINAGTDKAYFTSLVPRMGPGERFALYRGRTRLSPDVFDDTIRVADSPTQEKIVNHTASIYFVRNPTQDSVKDNVSGSGYSGYRRIRMWGVMKDAQAGNFYTIEGRFFPSYANSNIYSVPISTTRPERGVDYYYASWDATGTVANCIDNLKNQINKLFSGSIRATTGSLRPAHKNQCLFLRQNLPGTPAGKQKIILNNMTYTILNPSAPSGSIWSPQARIAGKSFMTGSWLAEGNNTRYLWLSGTEISGMQADKLGLLVKRPGWPQHSQIFGVKLGSYVTESNGEFETSNKVEGYFGAAQELDVHFVGNKNPVVKRINFEKEQMMFGDPPTVPEGQPYTEVNSFNPVSFIEADERSMWPVNLFNAGSLPHRVFDGVIEPLDIRSQLLQMNDGRHEGHTIRAMLDGEYVHSSYRGSIKIQHSRIRNDPAPRPFLDAPLSFNAGAVDLASGFNHSGVTGSIPENPTLAGIQHPMTMSAMQPYSDISVQSTNPFFERSDTEIVNDIQNFNNPIQVQRVKAQQGFNAYAEIDFERSYFVASTSLVLASTASCNLVLTSSDGTVRMYTGSVSATTAQWPPSGNEIVPFQVEDPRPSVALINQGSNIAALVDDESAQIRSPSNFPPGQALGPGNYLSTRKIRFASNYTPWSIKNGWRWDLVGPQQVQGAGGLANTYTSNVYTVGVQGLTSPAEVTQAIIDAINSPINNHAKQLHAEEYTTGSFVGIKITQNHPGEYSISNVLGATMDGTNSWKLSQFDPPGWRSNPQTVFSGSGAPWTDWYSKLDGPGIAPFATLLIAGTVPNNGDSFTIITPAKREHMKIPSLYTSASTFTYDTSVLPHEGGQNLGAGKQNMYKIGLSGITAFSNVEIDRYNAGYATALAIHNSIGNPISGTVRVISPGLDGLGQTAPGMILQQLWPALPGADTQTSVSYATDRKNFTLSNFTSGSTSSRSRKAGQRNLIAALTGSYGHSGKIAVRRRSTVAYPETKIVLTQQRAGTLGNTVISSSIAGTKVSPGAGLRPTLEKRQFGKFAGPPTANKPDISSVLDGMNPADNGDLNPKREKARSGFYFDKKAGSIIYGDEL